MWPKKNNRCPYQWGRYDVSFFPHPPPFNSVWCVQNVTLMTFSRISCWIFVEFLDIFLLLLAHFMYAVCIDVHINVCLCVSVYLRVCVFVCEHLCVCVCVCVFVLLFVCVYIYIYTCMCLFLSVGVFLFTCVCINTRTHTHICINMHMHRLCLPYIWVWACVCVCGMGWLWLVGSLKYRSLSQNIVSFVGLFCKRDLCLRMHRRCICIGYGVATVSRIDWIICLFCRISSLL